MLLWDRATEKVAWPQATGLGWCLSTDTGYDQLGTPWLGLTKLGIEYHGLSVCVLLPISDWLEPLGAAPWVGSLPMDFKCGSNLYRIATHCPVFRSVTRGGGELSSTSECDQGLSGDV